MRLPHLFLCMEPYSPRHVDSMYEEEARAGKAAGMTTSLISFEALVARGAPLESCRVPAPDEAPCPALYRGWMLRPAQYAILADALSARGYALLTTPDAYLAAHHLPASYDVIAAHTPRTRWLPVEAISREAVLREAEALGASALIVKDFAKSLKHDWHEACFVPDAGDDEALWRVVSRFLALRGDALEGGLVLREYVPLAVRATHPVSGLPLAVEVRLFVLDGALLIASDYWAEVAVDASVEALWARFAPTLRRVPSRFFTADLAQTASGDWIIVELGDAQVAGLPDGVQPDAFYQALASRLGA